QNLMGVPDIIDKLTDEFIERQVAGHSFVRGRKYAAEGAIFAGQREGNVVRALCTGSRSEPYRVEIIFYPDTSIEGGMLLARARCTCPVGESGRCKHVAAMLLAFRDAPESFVRIEGLAEALRRRPHEELVALIQTMVRQKPDLSQFIRGALNSVPANGQLVTEQPPGPARAALGASYEREIAEIFILVRTGENAEAGARRLEAIVNTGETLLKMGDVTLASQVYRVLAESALDHYHNRALAHSFEPHGLLGLVHRSISGLGECLATLTDNRSQATLRQNIVAALWSLLVRDLDAGGTSGLRHAVLEAIGSHATAVERQYVATWLRHRMATVEASLSDIRDSAERDADPAAQEQTRWHHGILASALIDIEGDSLGEDEFIARCRQSGRIPDLVAWLLHQRRHTEALTEALLVVRRPAGQGTDSMLVKVANVFVEHGRGDDAAAILAERAQSSDSRELLEWLIARYRQSSSDQPGDALPLVLRLFRQLPTIDRYREACDLADEVGRPSEIRQQLHRLVADSGLSSLQVRMYLVDGEFDAALAVLPQLTRSTRRLIDDVAEAVSGERPEVARQLYLRQARALIGRRGRKNYREACDYLVRARALYPAEISDLSWQRLIDQLREEHRSLRALRDELDRAGL
ncbi:MAG: SWIM zinc finger family protein, partial [Myxococcota bacterium]